MTDEYLLVAMREEVDPAELLARPFRIDYRNGYTINTGSPADALREIDRAGADYRVDVYATNKDGEQFPVFINEGRDNGIGADGLSELLDREGMTFPEAIERYTYGHVQADEIIHYQLEFMQEHHRE